jgi:hypothetical protein
MTYTVNVLVTSTAQAAYALLMVNDAGTTVLEVENCTCEKCGGGVLQ